MIISKRLLKKITLICLLIMLGGFAHMLGMEGQAGPAAGAGKLFPHNTTLAQFSAKKLAETIRSDAVLNEFRDCGTVMGKNPNDMPDDVAIKYFKPLFCDFAYQWVQEGVLQHQGLVNSAELTNVGNRIMTVSNGTVRVWHVENSLWVQEGVLRHQGWVNSAEFTNVGDRIMTVSNGTAQVWHLETDQWVQRGGEYQEENCSWKQQVCLKRGMLTKVYNKVRDRFVQLSNKEIHVHHLINVVGNRNVLAKIMLLQVLKRDGGSLRGREHPHLVEIFNQFDESVRDSLLPKYNYQTR